MGEGLNDFAGRAFTRAMTRWTLAAALGMATAAPATAFAATGTLDTGALTPQANGSRIAAEIMNSGASARTNGGEAPKPAQPAASPRQAGQHTGGATGRNRP